MARGAQEGGTRTYRATVAYDGTVYSGFQIQPERPTIQGELERALQRLTQQFVRIDGAGRTDTGVHAHGQVISFKARWSHGVETLQRAMNAVLPRDIAVRDVAEADERFHARFSARGRTYVYSIYQSEVRSPLLDRFAHHVTTPLYVDRMAQAGDKLIGEHDYAAFGQPPFGENTVRTVYRAEWRWQNAARGVGAMVELPPLLQFEIEANAFLRGMVRRLVGTLLQVGSGTLTVDDFVDILASQEIARAGVPAPACGLCLWHVRYAKQE